MMTHHQLIGIATLECQGSTPTTALVLAPYSSFFYCRGKRTMMKAQVIGFLPATQEIRTGLLAPSFSLTQFLPGEHWASEIANECSLRLSPVFQITLKTAFNVLLSPKRTINKDCHGVSSTTIRILSVSLVPPA